MAHMRWYSIGTIVLLAGCGTSHLDNGETTAESRSALSDADDSGASQGGIAAPSGVSAKRYTLSRKDPDARNHRTGLRAPTEAEEGRSEAEARTIVEIRPNLLALDRVARGEEEPASDSDALETVEPMRAEVGADLAAPEGDVVTVKGGAQAPSDDKTVANSRTTTQTFSGMRALPSSVDNSRLAAFPPIRDQGGLGSCVAFAVGYYQYTHELGRLQGWNNKNEYNGTKVSPRWLYNLVNNGGDYGSFYGMQYAVLKEQGAVMWSEFPYIADPTNPLSYRAWPLGLEKWKRAMRYAALEYGYLWPVTDPAIWQQAKGLLANGHVLVFGTTIYDWEFDDVDNDPATFRDDRFVGQAIATWVNGWEGGHGMALVGYNDRIWVDINGDGLVHPGEKGAFKVANSWGPYWQNSGYSWVAYDAFYATSQVPGGPQSDLRHSITDEVAWVTARPGYQPELVGEFTVRTNSRGEFSLRTERVELDRTEPFDGSWPSVFGGNGGPFRFDGTESTRSQEATFPIDLTDRALSYGDVRYRLAGNAWNSDGATLSRFTLVDRLRSGLRTVTADPPARLAGDGSQSVRYKFRNPNRVPNLAISPTSVAFGDVALASTSTRPVGLRNTGTGEVVVTSFRGHPLFQPSMGAPVYLSPGASTLLDLTFAPASSQLETVTLQIRSNDADQPSIAMPLSGTGTSSFDQAPLKVYVLQQSEPKDDSIAMRLSVTSSATEPLRLSDYKLVYYLNEPWTDHTGLVWDQTSTTFPTPVTERLRMVYLARSAGIRRADTALEFTFASPALIHPGQTLILEGRLHQGGGQLTFDETDDWSWYTRYDGLAENVVLESIGTKQVLFGSSPELAGGAYQMAVSPDPVSSTATVTFTIADPAMVGQSLWLDLKRDGMGWNIWPHEVVATGTQSVTVDLPSEFYPAGTYALVLNFYYIGAVDFVEFRHL